MPPDREPVRHEPALPAPFEPLFASLEEIRYADSGSRFHQCFGCGPGHDIGLRVRTFRALGEVLSPIVVPRRFEGPPEGAHGGIVAAYLDEVLAGAAVGHTGRVHWTGELSVRYVRPTPVERPLLGRAGAVRQSERYLDLEGTLEDLETGEVLARATGRFFPMREGSAAAAR
jgi:acyl-coenzyme A thioesterase PaaI-like protein